LCEGYPLAFWGVYFVIETKNSEPVNGVVYANHSRLIKAVSNARRILS
jgi:hypothetical protein